MTARVITGSKQEIAQQVANLEGDVREAIVFIEESAETRSHSTCASIPATEEELFREMEPYMVNVGTVDYSRAGIYSRKPGE